jgi:cytochrome P450
MALPVPLVVLTLFNYSLDVTVHYPKASRVITGHKAVREALRDTATYSSDLQGDADVRDYRQLPLEVDPPRHHLYRVALAPYFVKPSIEKLIPEFSVISQDLIHQLSLFQLVSRCPVGKVEPFQNPVACCNQSAVLLLLQATPPVQHDIDHKNQCC